MSATDAKSIATRCLEAWTTGDLDTVRSLVHRDVSFIGPLGTTDGDDAYISGLKGLAQIVKEARLRKVLGDDDDVCIFYDLVTTSPPATIPTAGWYHISNGKIAAVQAFFDARPFMGSND